MPEVFLSYARHDRAVAQSIALGLGKLGVDVWWDHDLLGGDDFRRQISDRLAKAQVVIVLWSQRAIASQWVVGEAAVASERRVLIPATLDRQAPPIDFRALHAIDLSDYAPGDPLPAPLVDAVAERLGRAIDVAAQPAPAGSLRRLSQRAAREWYADAESLVFYLIGQGLACALVNIPLAVYSARIPSWVPYVMATINGVIVAAIYLRPAIAGQRFAVAVPLLLLATAIGLASYAVTAWFLAHTTTEIFLTLVGFWTLALLLVTDVARRAAERR